MNVEEREMYDFANILIHSAGTKLKQEHKRSVIKVREKTSQMDLVTEHDLLIEKLLVKAILEKYPGHGILAEECQTWAISDLSGYTWVIDPIDGTINYYRFGKDYAISLALYLGEKPIFGLVFDVANGVMFAAGHGEGAIMNGYRLDILPDRQERLNKAVVGISLRTMRDFVGMGMDVLGMLSTVQAYRYLGCASLELCKVANGEYDLFISSNVHEWDVAAARVFLEQRGGGLLIRRKDDTRSRCGKLLVAAFRSPLIWEEAVEYLPQGLRDKFEA
ncbi:inositol monophosphatase family protein [Desulfosporosinus nitroreducens]|uniref:Inositol monophosphatase n=1 Tax=Desulfosporosinus nitroreducens TaxID=2018668 RepID=A0ABT8QV29_9FIRM|nr:inositol monophosphatase family protein [Desulfosporosinus nitroreducens]MCO1601626.1 hypothetical protein [Desulfosporosinus nitroreducens]MDO0825208.1 hypothetical protein [Desulfosporosinus nitroreducens]